MAEMSEEKLNSQMNQKRSDVYYLEYQKVTQRLGDQREECRAKKIEVENIAAGKKEIGDRILSKAEELRRLQGSGFDAYEISKSKG
jgi:hypothetical protein